VAANAADEGYSEAIKAAPEEKLYGQDFVNVYGDSNPNYQNIWEELNKQYVSIRDKAYVQLALQTFAKDVCENSKIVYTKESQVVPRLYPWRANQLEIKTPPKFRYTAFFMLVFL
jgi:hypothetical protein